MSAELAVLVASRQSQARPQPTPLAALVVAELRQRPVLPRRQAAVEAVLCSLARRAETALRARAAAAVVAHRLLAPLETAVPAWSSCVLVQL